MLEACHCIKHGAVSLDGGILRDNGVVSLGFGYLSLAACLHVDVCSSFLSFFFFFAWHDFNHEVFVGLSLIPQGAGSLHGCGKFLAGMVIPIDNVCTNLKS
jgi:hypothetical protein